MTLFCHFAWGVFNGLMKRTRLVRDCTKYTQFSSELELSLVVEAIEYTFYSCSWYNIPYEDHDSL